MSAQCYIIAFDGVPSENEEVVLQGRARPSDMILAAAAHYDSVSGSPGADGNASM